ncbi:MAG TPA: cellulase N-terminal Ig-like domain-containing protein, partial [Streptosporangiaceae bacterium]|nr:cellulase N-terminal Ig-like domain-containing protein [Streptosporangiaceae bacterium]
MRHGHRITLVAGTAIATASLLCAAAAAGAAPGARAGAAAGAPAGAAGGAPAQVRVNQVGYATGSPKVAFVMLPAQAGHVSFTVSGGHQVVFRGRSSADAGAWNAAYGAVYRLDFTGLNRTGT